MTPINQLHGAIEKFILFITSLPPEKLKLSLSYKWGPREVLIHLVFWHENYLEITKSLVKGEKPHLLTGSFKAANSVAVQEMGSVPISVLISRWLEAEQGLEKFYPQAKNLKIAFKEGGKVRDYQNAIARIAGHIESHLRQLK